MGLSIVGTDYSEKVLDRIDDPTNILHKLLPPSDEESAIFLAKIDWYGDTYLNYLQIKKFLEEWDQLRGRCETAAEKELVNAVVRLAERCREDRSLLRFIGD